MCKIKDALINGEIISSSNKERENPYKLKAKCICRMEDRREALGSFSRADEIGRESRSNPFN